VLLQDGSRVWLNASSSLRYPATFNGAERVVELRGEGYFEIAPVESPGAEKKKGPFIVKTEGMAVKVLGTRFNINAYKDEEIITTTLLEGSVSLSGRNQPGSAIRILKPGEQAKLYADEVIQVLENVDIEETVAWKNGQFKFNDARIETVMRQVSRWYDAEIVYRGTVNYHFNATIYRHEPVTKLLKVLEETDRVHFTIEGKKIIVRP
jgi:Fe2+-dicitrate sensor, membrane component